MENATYIALSRQMGLRRELDVVANNIANMNTTAYKAERMVFREYLDKPKHGEQLSYVQDMGMARDLTEGPLQSTGNPYDMAISGDGYFNVSTPLGNRYTRHGRFQLDSQNRLVTSQGDPVLTNNGAEIRIPLDSLNFSVSRDGTVSDEKGNTFGRIGVVNFQDPQKMRKAANGYFITDQKPQAVQAPDVVQGMLEGSNVKAILELTRMMQIQRDYDSANNFIKQQDESQKSMLERLRVSG